MSPNSAQDAATRLSERIIVREDFLELVAIVENVVATWILTHQTTAQPLDDLLLPGLRFADILSHSSNESHRNRAYTLIAMFQELKRQEQLKADSVAVLDAFSTAILSALGNFPGLQKLEDSVGPLDYSIPADRVIGRMIKESVQKTADGKYILTDAQNKLASNLRMLNYFSFSGPTSLGKSFVVKNFIKSEVATNAFEKGCVVFVVPTNALVSQTARDLRRELENFKDVHVGIHPVQPRLLLERFRTSVYVFTPERLIRYLSKGERDIKLLVVDEAHRIVAQKDARSPLFYFAISETLRTYAAKLIFSSPSLSNPELFLELFGKSTTGSALIQERTVAQQRFLVDFIVNKAVYFPSTPETQPVEIYIDDFSRQTPWSAIEFWASGTKSLVYVNTPAKVVEFALTYEPPSDVGLNSRVKNLIDRIREEIHPEYFLIDALERGIAFHHGRIPVAIREELEAVFKDPRSGVNFLVCTSTLLEGVNLPARNIFILTDKHGTGQKFGVMDFENLAGRAGRLTKDFLGNVFCLKLSRNEWNIPDEQIRAKAPQPVSSFLLEPKKSRKKQYTDIEKVLLRKPLPSGRTVAQRRTAERYAAILLIQSLNNYTSQLTQKFNERAEDAIGTLQRVSQEVQVSLEVLSKSPEFDPNVQELVRRRLSQVKAPVVIDSVDAITFESVFAILEEISRLYIWEDRETKGHDSLFRFKSKKEVFNRRLRYWAQLVLQWITGKPLSLVIQGAIRHYVKQSVIYVPDYSLPKGQSPFRLEAFSLDSKVHVNQVIEETMTDIEYGVGFRIMSYLRNYYDLCVHVFGEETAGLDLSVLIEFGTSNVTAIELQQFGYSRDASSELTNKGSKHLYLDESGTILQIRTDEILADEDISDAVKEETKELFVA